MKHMLKLGAGATLLALATAGAARAADVGVSISVSQPGVYGRIDIGRYPQPQVIVQQPVLVQPPRVVVTQPVEPVYLWVPPGHQRHWARHCARYNACGVPVYFVREDWYRQHVYVDRPQGGPPPGRGWRREDDEHGRGRGHGEH